jgi:hypothetical protein
MRKLDLHIIAGQSNAQRFYGNGDSYPLLIWRKPTRKSVSLYYAAPEHGSLEGKWGAMQAQFGMCRTRHFWPEVEFSHSLGRALAYKP